MAVYVFKRIFNSIVILLGMSFLLFLLVYLAPSDPARIIASQRLGGHIASSEDIEWVEKEYGLDRPVVVQYLMWLGRVIQGDLGYSFRTKNLVIDELKHSLGYSLALGGVTMCFVLLISIPLGVLAAMHEGSLWDHLMRLGSMIWVSVPEFWLAFLLILGFSVHLGWLPCYGAKSWRHFGLPMLSLGLGSAARLSCLIRSTLLQELHHDYMRTARGKGFSNRMSVIRHALPNVTAPFVTLAALHFSALASGSVIIETLFAWPGIGTYYVKGVEFRDIPVIQATVLTFAAIFMLTNLLAEVASVVTDPRICPE